MSGETRPVKPRPRKTPDQTPLQAEQEPARKSRDPLGKTLESYSTNQKTMRLWIGAGVLAIIGLWVVVKAEAIAIAHGRFMAGDGAVINVPLYSVMGWCLIAVAVFVAGYAWFNAGRRFEVRRRGVRYRNGRKVQEMTWDEVATWNLTRHYIVDLNSMNPTEVPNGIEIVIHSKDDSIYLSKTFLALIQDEEWLINTITKYANVEPTETNGDDAGRRKSGGNRRPSKSEEDTRPKKWKSGTTNPPKLVAQKLGSGMAADEVLDWLERKHNMPPNVAEKVLAKAVAEYPEQFDSDDFR